MKTKFINEVIAAIENHEIRAYYQPQYDANSGKLISAEALVRWVKPDGKIISPDMFIPKLEKTNAINLLDWYMAEEACRTIKELGSNAVPIAVNFSRWHIGERDFARKLQSIMSTYNVNPEMIEVEITESVISISDIDIVKSWTEEISRLGTKIAIDDFGTGFTSLQFVKNLPVDYLKIDKAFLDDNCQDEKGRATLETVFFFAHKLNLRTIAEGVETIEQLKFLQNMDCDKVQGYLFSKPLSKEDFLVIAMMDKVPTIDTDNFVKRQGTLSTHSLLFKAIKEEFQLVIFGNLYKNSYYLMHQAEGMNFKAATAGVIDDMTLNACKLCTSKEMATQYKNTLSREALIRAFHSGQDRVEATIEQKIGEEVFVFTTIIHLMKHPYKDDVLMIGMSRCR